VLDDVEAPVACEATRYAGEMTLEEDVYLSVERRMWPAAQQAAETIIFRPAESHTTACCSIHGCSDESHASTA